jgi:hypothetical protein
MTQPAVPDATTKVFSGGASWSLRTPREPTTGFPSPPTGTCPVASTPGPPRALDCVTGASTGCLSTPARSPGTWPAPSGPTTVGTGGSPCTSRPKRSAGSGCTPAASRVLGLRGEMPAAVRSGLVSCLPRRLRLARWITGDARRALLDISARDRRLTDHRRPLGGGVRFRPRATLREGRSADVGHFRSGRSPLGGWTTRTNCISHRLADAL